MYRITLVLAVSAMILAGCAGSTETVTAGQSTGSENSPPTTSSAAPDSGPPPSESDGEQRGSVQTVPEPAAEVLKQRETPERPGLGNANRRKASPMESLCWANREVSRLMLRSAVVPDNERARADRAILDSFVRSAPTVLETLDQLDGELPEDVLPFAERLRSEIETAMRTADDPQAGSVDVFQGFDYDNWPAVDAYAVRAQSAGCAQLV